MTKIVRNGGFHFPDYDPDGHPDHKVAIEGGDGGDYLDYKLLVDSTMSKTITGTPGHESLTLGADVSTIVTEITNNPTLVTSITETIVENPVNVTIINGAQPTPTQVASTLYTAMVPDPRNHGQVACCFLGQHTKGSNTPMLMDGAWTTIAPGVLQRNTAGLLPSAWLDGVDPTPAYGHVSSLVGKTVLIYYQGDASILGDEEPLQGPYILDDVGASWQHVDGDPPGVLRLVSTYARMHRAPDYSISSQFVQNMTFQVQTGNAYGTGFLTLTNASVVLGTTPLTWDFTSGPTFAWTQQYRLLAGPQLISEGASNETLEVVATTDVATAGGNIILGESFLTLIGTPGLDALPAGIWKSDNEQVYLEAPGSPGSITTLRWAIWNDNTSTVLFTMESPPISTTVPMALQFQYLDAGHSISPTDSLEAVPWLHTTSTTPVTLHLRYSSPGHGTRFTVPFALPITGAATVRHPDLSLRNAALQHPLSSLYSVGETETSASGWVDFAVGPPFGDRSDYVRLTLSGGTLYGISKNWTDGTPIPDCFVMTVYIVGAAPSTPKQVVSGATPPDGSDFLPLANDAIGGVAKQHEFSGPTELRYRLDLTEQRWRIVSYQTYTVVTS